MLRLNAKVFGTTRVIGILGHPVHHSMSPVMQNTAFEALSLDYVYVPFDVAPDDLQRGIDGIRALGFAGANITIPHKERVIDFLDWVSEEARAIGSVNTIVNDEGILKGYSTDGEGFMRALEAAGGTAKGSQAVVLGAGGSARAIVYALAKAGAKVAVANRTFSRAVELADFMNVVLGSELIEPIALQSEAAGEAVRSANLLVNCTSVGMYPKVDCQPVPSEWLHKELFIFDQIYNPLETSLLRAARAIGLQTANGIGMLVYQGASSFKIWTGMNPPTDAMEKAVLTKMGVVL